MWFATTQPDLVEGIRAQVVDKDRSPRWQPATIAELAPDAAASALAYRADDAALGLTGEDRWTTTSRAPRRYSIGDRDRLVLLRLRRPRRGVARLPELHRDVPASGGGASPVAIAFWVLLAYLVLPRLHRILTTIYVPDYFIGRARTSDGLLGDPVNLAFLGEAEQIHAAMAAAGWTQADAGHARLVVAHRHVDAHAAQLRRGAGQPAVPLRPPAGLRLPAGGRRQPAQRHHVRFWKCPDGWLLPGRLAASTGSPRARSTRPSGLSLFTLQVTHKIDADTDIERDHIVRDGDRGRSAGRGRRCSRTSRPAITRATAAATASAPTAICRSSTSARSTEVTRDDATHPHKRPAFEPAARLLKPIGYDPEMQRPPSTVAGVRAGAAARRWPA